tara:strand:+ start:67 stop:555 length:489 start_codon:yes stop_codon:yes gene_type:complete
MIEQSAKVVEVKEDYLLIITDEKIGCNSCEVQSGCGTSLIGKFFSKRSDRKLKLPKNNMQSVPTVGSEIVIGIDETFLRFSSIVLYVIPLLGLLFGAIFGSFLGNLNIFIFLSEDVLSISFCIAGTIIGFKVTKIILNSRNKEIGDSVKIVRVRNETLLSDL